jgi:HK97 gp10 family phage protein
VRLERVRIKEVSEEIFGQAIENAGVFMDQVVEAAKARCPVGTITRDGKWTTGNVSFTPSKGKNKGSLVEFEGKRWTGREPGDLKKTIRRVVNEKKKSNFRVYAGSYKIYWAYMVEMGTSKMAARPFLRPAFEAAKTVMNQIIKYGG